MGDNNTGIIGIDPGISGAVGVLAPGAPPMVFDPPTVKFPVGGKTRSQILEPAAGKLIKEIIAARPGVQWRAVIEWAQAMPIIHVRKDEKPCETCGRVGNIEDVAQQGAVSAFSYGEGFGIWKGVLGALEIPFVMLRPQHWKNLMLAGFAEKNKDASRIVAARLFPGADLGRRKDQGRAEGLLIAECGRRMFAAEEAPRAVSR